MTLIERLGHALRSKQWRIALFEFVLIFLAVLFGTWAESWRLNLSARENLKSTLELMVKNLEEDLHNDSLYINTTDSANKVLSEIILNLDHSNSDEQKIRFYELSRRIWTSNWHLMPIPQSAAYYLFSKDGYYSLVKSDSIMVLINDYYVNYKNYIDVQRDRGYAAAEDLSQALHFIYDAEIGYYIRRNTSQFKDSIDYQQLIRKKGYRPFTEEQKNEYLWKLQMLYGLSIVNSSRSKNSILRASLLRSKIKQYLRKLD